MKNIQMKHKLLLLFLLPMTIFSQVSGVVFEAENNEPIYGAKVISSTGEKAKTDFDGKFTLNLSSYPATLVISAQTFLNDTVEVMTSGTIKIIMDPVVQKMKTVVVAAGRRKQEIENVPISMEIIRPELFDNKGLQNVEQAVDQSPGVFTMDGQVSIRGGSGFSYGAGSRVLLLWNGIPILSGDAGDAKWNAIPMEMASQIEVLKGASSVLYGSGALNGIISLTEREPSTKGELRFKAQSGIYDNPKRASLKWWSKNPMFHQADVYYGKMKKGFGYTVSANGFTSDGYREGELENRGRISGSLFIRPEKIKNLKAGVGYNMQYQKAGNFIIWENDSLGYNPSGGADTSDVNSTLTYIAGIRLSIDPYAKFFDRYKNIHTIKTRLYFVRNNNLNNPSQSSTSTVSYADYQFLHKWSEGTAITAGLTGTRTDVKSNLYGDHFANNIAAYTQFEKRFDKLDLTGGVRFEYQEQDNRRGDTDFYIGKDSTTKIPIYPIFRLGAHYQVAKFSHIRASFGQGIRYPAVAERYTKTSVGSLNIFPNPLLRPETGWAAELGFKQAIKIGENWKGLFDVAGFINVYDNMMEFQFGVFNPISGERLDASSPDFANIISDVFAAGYTINDIFGFSAVNAESARITGAEISFNSQGTIGDVELTSLLGYTYMNPISQNTDSAYRSTFSDTTTNMLKYRFNHLAKADIEAKWKGISLGASMRFNSYMTNIDRIFEDEITSGVYILPGLKEYRQEHNQPTIVFDARVGYEFGKHYRVGFIVNNLLNEEYVTRPGDIQPPRSYIVQLQMKF